jgi:transcriptional regulator with XRE-family HTH domain
MLGVMTEPTPPRYLAVSAHVRAISERMEALRLSRGMTRRQLALAAGVHPTQLSQILLGHQGMSLDRAADILGVLGAALSVTALDERAPLRLGHVDPSGAVLLERPLVLPGSVVCGEALPGLAAGEELHFRPASDFESGRLMLVALGERLALRRGVELGGMAFLRDMAGDDLRHVPDRHRVVAVAYAAWRPL